MHLLLEQKNYDRLQRGAIDGVARKQVIICFTIRRIWNQELESRQQGAAAYDVSSLKKISGRHPKDYDGVLESISDAPFNQRGTLRSTSSAIGMPKSTLQYFLKGVKIGSHYDKENPMLNADNRERFFLVYLILIFLEKCLMT